MASSVAHFVVSLGANGRIVSQGSISEAIAKDVTFAAEVAKEQEVIDKEAEVIDTPEEPKADAKKSDGKLVMSEEIMEGHVSWAACPFRSQNLGALLTSYSSQTLPGRLGRKLSYDVLGRVLGAYYIDGLPQHYTNMVPRVLGISV